MTTEIKNGCCNQEECVITPPVDIYETENEFVLKADITGAKKENVEIRLENNELEIEVKIDEDEKNSGDLKYSEYTLNNFYRKFTVGNNIDNNSISAKLDNGVLTLILPKKEEAKPKKIEIKAE